MAMGLASMNPVVGSGRPQTGGLLMKVDKDIENDGWGDYFVTRHIDSDSYLGIDRNGKVNYKKSKLIESSNVYIIRNENTDDIFNTLLEEVSLPYQERQMHGSNYIYEAFTGNKVYMEDQADYDVLLERLYLDKLSKSLSAEADNLKNEFNREKYKKGIHYPLEEKPNYTQDWDQPDAGVKFPLLAAAEYIEKELQSIQESKEGEEVE